MIRTDESVRNVKSLLKGVLLTALIICGCAGFCYRMNADHAYSLFRRELVFVNSSGSEILVTHAEVKYIVKPHDKTNVGYTASLGAPFQLTCRVIASGLEYDLYLSKDKLAKTDDGERVFAEVSQTVENKQ